jgi:three-Cys-motif partner protein
VAIGTSSGLLDEHRTQSVFKHKILEAYFVPFAEMTGSRADGERVVGFAGRGRYPDGSPASAELILQTSRRSRLAVVESVLVEKKRADRLHLKALASEYAVFGVKSDVLGGNVIEHLPTVVRQSAGVPSFMFLDPCGAGLPFDDLAGVLAGPRRSRWPATEVLLNFSADLNRRAASALKARQLEHDALPVMDSTCGGPWWRDVALTAHAAAPANFEAAAFAVVEEYARRLGVKTGMVAVTVPVRRRIHHQPVYHLVFMSRREHGFWVFAEAVATARHEWMRVLGPTEDGDDGALFSYGESVDHHIDSEQIRVQEDVAGNLLRLLAVKRRVKLVDEPWAVFGDRYGVATESTVRKAVRGLHRSGQLVVVDSPRHLRDMTIAAADITPS